MNFAFFFIGRLLLFRWFDSKAARVYVQSVKFKQPIAVIMTVLPDYSVLCSILKNLKTPPTYLLWRGWVDSSYELIPRSERGSTAAITGYWLNLRKHRKSVKIFSVLITRCAYAQGRVKRLSPSIMCVCVCGLCRQKTWLFAVLVENRHEIALYRSASQFNSSSARCGQVFCVWVAKAAAQIFAVSKFYIEISLMSIDCIN